MCRKIVILRSKVFYHAKVFHFLFLAANALTHPSDNTAQKMKFSIKDFSVNVSNFSVNPQFLADLVTFTEEILKKKTRKQ